MKKSKKTKAPADIYAHAAAAIKKQIADRVAPAPRKSNEIKKVYKEGSPGHARKLLGTTLTQLKARINEPGALIVYGVDESGQPTGEVVSVTPFRDTATVTKRRRHAIANAILGTGNIGQDARQRRDRYAAANSKGSKKAKKSWHMNGDRLTAAARAEDAKTKAKGKK